MPCNLRGRIPVSRDEGRDDGFGPDSEVDRMPLMHRCQECGSDVHAALSPRGLCPSCLLWLGLGAEDPGEQETLPSPAPPRTPWDQTNATLGSRRTFGTYRIERLLGKGGMGEVYEAVDEENGRRLALKILTRGLGDPGERARFLREGRLAASINHPNTVYIYGTEEIEGLPIITMELASAGTLKDLVKDEGPLPPVRAVDAILQVIAGLEAASAADILHRDVKPSNCFVDGEGRVKVGDFGLSISTLAHAERDVTTTGTFLGTPAFASPEQLRCESLDLRSDIYAVGATLHYLLTGRAPFEDQNILKLATRIAEEQPPPLQSLRPDIPRGLSRVVARCLAKRPADRFETHAALAAELEPFSSRAPVPAGAGLRAAAGVLDWFTLGVLLTPLALYFQWVAPEASSGPVRLAMYLIVGALYFGILESRSTSSIGKWLCGLRVVDPGGEKIAPWRALARGALFVALLQSVNVLGAAGLIDVEPPPGIQFYPPLNFGLLIRAGFEASAGVNFQWFAGIALLFLTARRRNGFAGLHDLGTRTRVVMKRSTEAPSTVVTEPVFAPPTTSSTSIGPYEVLEPLGEGLLLGYDGRLRRRVWIRVLPQGAAALPPRRRDLSRPARLRWLNGRRTADECWDVYEAVDGAPLVQRLDRPHPWSAASLWLLDLTRELTAGLHDRSLPDLGLDRVWITPDGRARLLDWPVRPANDSTQPTKTVAGATVDLESAQDFLRSVALSALAGRIVSHHAALRELALPPLPLWARSLLQRLGRQGFGSPEELAGATALLDRRPACVTARQRLLHLAASSAVPAMVAMCLVPGLSMILVWGPQHPDTVELTECLTELGQLEQLRSTEEGSRAERLQELGYDEEDLDQAIRALEVYVAGRHRNRAADPSTWSQPFVSADQRGLAEHILATYPSPSDADVGAAREDLVPFFKRLAGFHPEFRAPLSTRAHMVLTVPLAFLPWVAALGLISAALFRGGLLLRGLGVVVVARSGAEASRLRSFVRAVVGWAPALLLGLLVYVDGEPNPATSVLEWISVPVLVGYAVSTTALLAGVAWMVREPARGFQDRVAGTYVVPR